MSLLDRGAEIVEAIEARGVRATLDPRAVLAPCVLLYPPTLAPYTECAQSVTWTLQLIGVGVGGDATWAVFDVLFPAVLDALVDVVGGFDSARPDVFYPATGPGSTDAVPCYTLTATDSVSWDQP